MAESCTRAASANNSAPMEVDALKGWRSKSSDKSKGKGNGKSSGKTKDGKARFEGACNGCGKTVHKLADCWLNKSAHTGKGDKVKGKGKPEYKSKGQDIVCYKCDKKGHYAKDCWSKPKQAAETGKDVKEIGAIECQDCRDDDWLMAVDTHGEENEDYAEIAALTVEKKITGS